MSRRTWGDRDRVRRRIGRLGLDTLTHGIAGALLARALPPAKDPALDARLRRGEMLLGFAAAMFPDADALLDPFSPEFYITQHRGLTHSFVLTPVWALLLAAVVSIRHRNLPREERRHARWRLAAVAAIGVVSHIVLDWITSWGTMFFSPLSWARYSLDWLFIIDFVLSGLLVLGLLGAWRAARVSDSRSRWAARAGLLAATAYVLFCGVRHADALEASRRVLPAGVVSRAAIPQPLSPDRWLLLGDDGKEVSASYVDLSRHGGKPPSASDPLPKKGGVRSLLVRLADLYAPVDAASLHLIPHENGPLAHQALFGGDASIFGRFARFPAAREERGADGAVKVVVRDVRFGYLSDGVDPFTYVLRYDARGKLEEAGFPSPRWSAKTRPPTHAGVAGVVP